MRNITYALDADGALTARYTHAEAPPLADATAAAEAESERQGIRRARIYFGRARWEGEQQALSSTAGDVDIWHWLDHPTWAELHGERA